MGKNRTRKLQRNHPPKPAPQARKLRPTAEYNRSAIEELREKGETTMVWPASARMTFMHEDTVATHRNRGWRTGK